MNPNKTPWYSDDFRTAICRVLSFVMAEDRANAVTDRLLSSYGDISLLASTGIEALAEVDGMNMNAAILLKLLVSACSRVRTEGFRFGERHTDAEIEDYFKGIFLGLEYETVFMMIFDARDRVVSCERISEGSVCASEIHARRMLEIAIRRGAHSVVIAHNHPRGLAEPSMDDTYATGRLMQVMRSSGITLRCHYAVAGDRVARVPMPEEYL